MHEFSLMKKENKPIAKKDVCSVCVDVFETQRYKKKNVNLIKTIFIWNGNIKFQELPFLVFISIHFLLDSNRKRKEKLVW